MVKCANCNVVDGESSSTIVPSRIMMVSESQVDSSIIRIIVYVECLGYDACFDWNIELKDINLSLQSLSYTQRIVLATSELQR